MEEKQLYAKIVKSGTWLYDNQVPHEVWIVQQNFDYYYDEGFEDNPEQLNAGDELFQIIFAFEGTIRSIAPACFDLDKAVADAEKRLAENQLVWTDHRIQPLFNGRRYSLAAAPDERAGGTAIFNTSVD